jgi:hypothetical protein
MKFAGEYAMQVHSKWRAKYQEPLVYTERLKNILRIKCTMLLLHALKIK